MNTYEYIKYYTGKSIRDNYQISNATIKRAHTNSTYDIVTIIGSDDYPLFNISPVDPKVVFSVNDNVTVLIPVGNKQLTRILGYSNIQFPSEEIIEFNEPEAVGNIYLCCPDDGLIKVYSLAGAAGTDISPESNALYNIISSGDYLYCSSNSAYVAFMVKPDGTGYQEIVSQSRYYDARGLAINPAGTHLYIAYSTWEPSLGIAKINISTGEIEETELTDVSFDGISDLCGDGVYLYLLGHNIEAGKIAVYDFNLNFVREISVSDIFEKITADGTNIYLSNSSKVDIYSLSGTFVRSISESGIRAVAVKGGKIYIVVEEYSGGAT